MQITQDHPELRPIIDLLTDYMIHSSAGRFPGSDGLRIDDILAGYELLASVGEVPTERELCLRHPEYAARLTAFFYINHQPGI